MENVSFMFIVGDLEKIMTNDQLEYYKVTISHLYDEFVINEYKYNLEKVKNQCKDCSDSNWIVMLAICAEVLGERKINVIEHS